MSVCFEFAPAAWEEPRARHAIDTVASLLPWRWRSAPSGTHVEPGEAIVYVGPAVDAPLAAAAVVPFDGWPVWRPGDLGVADWDGVPQLCPGGDCHPAATPRELPQTWLRSIGFLLGREEERLDRRRDRWECYSGLYTIQHRLGVLEQPLVNMQARQLERRIAGWLESRNLSPETLPLWPKGARFAVALTHDVDDVTLYALVNAGRLLVRARSPFSYAVRGGLKSLERTVRARLGGQAGAIDPYWSFDRWANEEESRGFRSTFYVWPSRPARAHELDPLYRMDDRLAFEGAATRFAGVLRTLHGRGFEIGLHGSYLSHRDGEELARQRRQIEEAVGAEVRGIRQHFLRFDVEHTWRAQEHAGFHYDATLGYNEAIGFRAGIAAPFHPWDEDAGTAHRLLEVPLTAMDGVFFRTLGHDAAHAAAHARAHLEEVERIGGLAVLLWHPNAADEDHFPGWWRSWVETLSWLERRGAWVTSAGEVARWWRERSRRQRAAFGAPAGPA